MLATAPAAFFFPSPFFSAAGELFFPPFSEPPELVGPSSASACCFFSKRDSPRRGKSGSPPVTAEPGTRFCQAFFTTLSE